MQVHGTLKVFTHLAKVMTYLNKVQAFKVKTTCQLLWCTYGKNSSLCKAHAKRPLFPCKNKTMGPTLHTKPYHPHLHAHG